MYKFIAKYTVFLALAACAAHSTHVLACANTNLTKLEKAFCQLKPKNKSLPRFHEFRKNTPTMQYLLLKQPAKKAGLAIKKPNRKSAKRLLSKEKHVDLPAKNEAFVSETESRSRNSTHAVNNVNMQQCALSDRTITCNHKLYIHQKNLPKSRLKRQSLSASNKLNLSVIHNARDTGLVDQLSDAYSQYIEKMIEIGLAQSTMSFTKFSAQYAQTQKAGINFNERMETMFTILKQEKASRPFSAEPFSAPSNINQCDKLTSNIIVCDDIHTTWLYTHD